MVIKHCFTCNNLINLESGCSHLKIMKFQVFLLFKKNQKSEENNPIFDIKRRILFVIIKEKEYVLCIIYIEDIKSLKYI